ncbi:MAG: phosphatase PAP2 family protein [Clostridiaceae bacterium]|jgi:membrane-associated phospholipid phosphatase|nr:phosphatase PAP2 family protein [Clostridiaceae bacterium]
METEQKNMAEEVKIPELQIHSVWKRLINRVRHVGFIYWVIMIIAALIIVLSLIPDTALQTFWEKIEEQKLLVSLVLIFGAVTLSLVWEKGQQIDVWVFNLFNMRGRRPKWVDWMMLGITQLGSGVFALMLAAFFYFFIDNLLAYEVVLGSLTLWLIVEIMKLIIRRKRPFLHLKEIRIVGERARGHSFPSGHTSQAFFLATLLLQHFNAVFAGGIIIYIIALLVGITRIYIGVHYPRDVIGGSVLGTAWGIVWAIINSYIR